MIYITGHRALVLCRHPCILLNVSFVTGKHWWLRWTELQSLTSVVAPLVKTQFWEAVFALRVLRRQNIHRAFPVIGNFSLLFFPAGKQIKCVTDSTLFLPHISSCLSPFFPCQSASVLWEWEWHKQQILLSPATLNPALPLLFPPLYLSPFATLLCSSPPPAWICLGSISSQLKVNLVKMSALQRAPMKEKAELMGCPAGWLYTSASCILGHTK